MDRVDKCNELLKLIWFVGLGVLDRIGIMDELAVSLQMPKTKQQSGKYCTPRKDRGVLFRNKSMRLRKKG
jgi:hypothetical protein